MTMVVELVTTGSELLLGQIVNTNSAYMAAGLNKIGFDVVYQTTVGDNQKRMTEAIEHALSRADIVITSGGLGPTQGDITKQVCAGVFGRVLSLNEECADRIRAHFNRLHRVAMTENTMRQAMIPEGAVIFKNYAGTAPGIVLEEGGKIIINLPGPPSEMKDMFERSVKPFLKEKYGFRSVIISRVLNTFGIGESLLEESIKDLILAQKNPTLALLVRPGGVILRITAKADKEADANLLIGRMEKEIRSRIGEYIYAVDDADMEDVVGKLLREKGLTIACAESCTGGLMTSRLTDVAGSSDYVMGSIISYTNEVKIKELGVPSTLLAQQGAVCEDVAKAMAKGAQTRLSTDIGVGITGIAGPDGGSEEKPVGLVYIAVAGPTGTVAAKKIFTGKRKAIKYRTTQTALDMVRHYIGDM
jgi:nicotinamide-nucleotide amidase